MVRFAALVAGLSLAGCSFAPASRSGRLEHEEPPLHVPSVGDRYDFGPVEGLQPGRWARYRFSQGPTGQELTLGVVARTGEKAWLEVVEEGDPRRASLRLIDAEGLVEKAFFRELPAKGDPTAVMPQGITQSGAAPEKPAPESVTVAAGQETVAGRALQVSVEKALFRDEELGREYSEEHVWSREVPPLFAGSDRGGLVRRATPKGLVQLVDFGDGYKPVIPPPGP